MNKTQLQAIICEMMQTAQSIRDAHKNADGFYTESEIKNNMMQYFAGLAKVAEILTGDEWHWSNDETGKWSVVRYSPTLVKYTSYLI